MWTYQAVVTRVVDGDTFEAKVDVGFYHYCVQRFRVLNYNAPECEKEERTLGEMAKSILMSMLLGRSVILHTHKGDSFGRWLASVEVEGRDLAETLISDGWGVFWSGKGERPKFDPTAKYPLEV